MKSHLKKEGQQKRNLEGMLKEMLMKIRLIKKEQKKRNLKGMLKEKPMKSHLKREDQLINQHKEKQRSQSRWEQNLVEGKLFLMQ